MGILVTAIPIDDDVREWLVKICVPDVPPDSGRRPRAHELRAVIEGIEGYRVSYRPTSQGWDAELVDGEGVVHATVWVKTPAGDGPVEFHFHKSDVVVTVEITRALTERCGPYFMMDAGVATPVVVHPDIDVAEVARRLFEVDPG